MIRMRPIVRIRGPYIAVATGLSFLAVVLAMYWAGPSNDDEPRAMMAAAEPAPPSVGPNCTVTDRLPPRETLHADSVDLPAHAPVIRSGCETGVVIAPEGSPLPRVSVRLIGKVKGCDVESTVVSREGGVFEAPSGFEGIGRSGDEHLVAVFEAVFSGRKSSVDPLLVLTPALVLAGHVVDETGCPIGDASLNINWRKQGQPILPYSLEASRPVEFRTITGPDGAFAFPSAPYLGPEGRLAVCRQGYVTLEEAAPTHTDLDMSIVLRKAGPFAQPLSGIVIDAQGVPIAGAYVSVVNPAKATRVFFPTSAVTSASGEFELGLSVLPNNDRLLCVAKGHLPAEIERPPEGWPAYLVITLEGAPLGISGMVCDERSRPLADIIVTTVGRRCFGKVNGVLTSMEEVLGGSAFVRTNDRGEFLLTGLLPGTYQLRVLEERTLLGDTTGDIPAGSSGVVIVLPRAGLVAVRGHVHDLRGRPLVGVSVGTTAVMYELDGFGGKGQAGLSGPRTVTGDEGQFVLREVGRKGVKVGFTGKGVMPAVLSIPESVAAGSVWDVALEGRCRFRVELEANGSDVTSFSMEDDRGEELPVESSHAQMYRCSQRHPIRDGRSEVGCVSDRARQLVLFRGDEELRRVVVTLSTDGVTVIRG